MKTIITAAWLVVAATVPSAFGQLILTGPDSTNVPCGTPVTLTATVEETNGLPVIVTWWLNDVAVETNAVPATNSIVPTDFTLTGVFPTGTNLVDVVAENSDGLLVTNSAIVIEADTNPPVIVSASPSKSSLWPPNHKMVKVDVSAVVTDDCSTPTWKIISVTSNEDPYAKGSGKFAPDWQILGDHSVNLRAERGGPGSGRVYTISLQAVDSVGNLSATNTITVKVPHDQGKGKGKNDDNGSDNGKGKGKGKGNK